MSRFVQAFSDFVEIYLLPFTQHRLWPAIYPTLIILLGLMSAFQQKYVGDVIRVLFVILFLAFGVTYAWMRLDPKSLRFRWVAICQRHHVQFFQGMMLSTALLNFGLRRAPHLEVVSYRRGSLPDHVQKERAELTRRFSETAGYLVTFDGEATRSLAQEGVQIGGKTYKLCSMPVLGLKESLSAYGLQLDKRADINSTAESVGQHARALFWGLSGVVVKQPRPSSTVGGIPFKEINGQRTIDLRALIAALNSSFPPTCPVYILNWPVLLWNLLAITVAGKADLYLEAEITAAESLRNDLKAAASTAAVTVVDNPYVLMEAIEADQEAIIIGGGSWLLSPQTPETTLLPVWTDTAPVFSKYIECLGYLLPDSQPTRKTMVDIGRLDRWIVNRFKREILMTTSAAKATRVGLPCWVTHLDVLGDLPSLGSLIGIKILERVISPGTPERMSIFEIE